MAVLRILMTLCARGKSWKEDPSKIPVSFFAFNTNINIIPVHLLMTRAIRCERSSIDGRIRARRVVTCQLRFGGKMPCASFTTS